MTQSGARQCRAAPGREITNITHCQLYNLSQFLSMAKTLTSCETCPSATVSWSVTSAKRTGWVDSGRCKSASVQGGSWKGDHKHYTLPSVQSLSQFLSMTKMLTSCETCPSTSTTVSWSSTSAERTGWVDSGWCTSASV